MINYELLRAEAERHPYPLLFATVSGAHLYGFPSPDSDYDLRGAHVLPIKEALGMLRRRDAVESEGSCDGKRTVLATQDALKFFTLLTKRNGYVLEQLYSPLIVETSAWHEELKHIGRACATRWHYQYYLGFAEAEWKCLGEEEAPKARHLLFVFRALLEGIHLMLTRSVESNLVVLNDEYRLPYVTELLARASEGAEDDRLELPEMSFFAREYRQLSARLEEAAEISQLPEEASCIEALNDLLVRVRMDE